MLRARNSMSSEWVRPGMWYACMCGTTGTRAYQVLIAAPLTGEPTEPRALFQGGRAMRGSMEKTWPFLSSGLSTLPASAPCSSANSAKT